MRHPHAKKWTRAECEIIVDKGIADLKPYELIDGDIIRTPKPMKFVRRIQILVERLGDVFGRDFVMQYMSMDVAPEDSVANWPDPDVVVLTRSIFEMKDEEHLNPSHVRLLVEVAEEFLELYLNTKAGLYARAGIADYWVLDPQGRRMIVHRSPSNGQYGLVEAYLEHEAVSPLAAPEASLPVADLL